MSVKPSVWSKIVNNVGDVAVKGVKKHPVITAGVVGTGAAVGQANEARKRTEEDIMANYTGKYASVRALAKFRAEHTKVAEGPSIGDAITSGFGRSLGTEAISQGLGAINAVRDSISDRIVYQPRRDNILKQLVATDPIISRYEQENPGKTVEMYKTMSRFAPTLSTDQSAVASFLRNAAMTGGVMDYKTIEGLAGAELMINRATNPNYR